MKGKTAVFSTFIIPMLICLFNAMLIIYPREVFTAAKDGVGLWFNNVLPSLLPFMVGINILTGTGFASFIGELLSPVMTLLFDIPGAGGFALFAGLTSGYPMGAKTAAQLRMDGKLSPSEAQRLVGFCNNAGPLFIVGVAGTGLFGSAAAGYCLWLSHFTAALTVGLLLRFTISKKQKSFTRKNQHGILTRALDAYATYRRENDCTFGRVLGDSVKNAMESVTIIGGYIIFFSVLTQILSVTGVLNNTSALFNGTTAGLLEMTNGVQLLASSVKTEAGQRIALSCAAAVISFGGFSIHAQTLHFIRGSDIKALPYLLTKGLNAILAFAFCWLFYLFFENSMAISIPAMRLWAGAIPAWWREAFILSAITMVLLPVIIYITVQMSVNKKRLDKQKYKAKNRRYGIILKK